MQVEDPAVDVYPAAHGEQVLPLMYWLAEHDRGVQEADPLHPGFEVVPTGHVEHWLPSAYWFAGQDKGEHEADPGYDDVPEGQDEHADAPPVENVLAEQAWQEVTLPPAEN